MMVRWPKNRMWCMVLFFAALLLLLAGCSSGNGGSDNCGGIDDIISCVYVTDVAPDNVQVDVADCNADGFPDPPVEADTVTVTFLNDAFPSFIDGVTPENLDVQVTSFRVSYVPRCGQGQVCPALSDQSDPVVVFINDNGGTASQSVTIVSTATKQQYAAGTAGLPDNVASYTANFVFNAQTVGFEDNFDFSVSVPFTIGNFSCP